MLRPPYWFHKNIETPSEEIEQVIDGLKKSGKELMVRQYSYLSSYFLNCIKDLIRFGKKNIAI